MAKRDEKAAGMYLGSPCDKDRPWLYTDYLALAWYVREGAPVTVIAAEMNREPGEIERRIREIPWARIAAGRRTYTEWSRARRVVQM